MTETSKRAPPTLGKRWATCDEVPNTHAQVPDAVACINYLASLGGLLCRAATYSRFCNIGTAIIDGNSRVPSTASTW
jgi:hypothetical protein